MEKLNTKKLAQSRLSDEDIFFSEDEANLFDEDALTDEDFIHDFGDELSDDGIGDDDYAYYESEETFNDGENEFSLDEEITEDDDSLIVHEDALSADEHNDDEISFDEEGTDELLNDLDHEILETSEEESNLEIEKPQEDTGFDSLFDDFIPGTDLPKNENDDSFTEKVEEKPPEPPKPTDWEHDRDPKHFAEYLRGMIKNVPQHTGTTTVGCERAITYLQNLNREISEAVRLDLKSEIPLDLLEKARDWIEDGVTKLKERIRLISKNQKVKKASHDSTDEFIKEAQLPRLTLTMTPFERAITGIIVNSVVSAGRPFDEVYEFLKDKYKLTEREELSVMQILMDMGMPIFKDRATIGNKEKADKEQKGVDFITTYLA